ncbi:protein EPIDERMAL PATTERNING FACTOR 2-like [Salvia hispanica]|uniref:protein EPIDERMAL PATTERNING FACTOR 2-like n=1 Tax=Salvia hispanica TaxID=49212 RepID=UPI00200964FC|nr:protein EPIDERMAL PATTERNING FACTOR 2-like [Salvia hispanica]
MSNYIFLPSTFSINIFIIFFLLTPCHSLRPIHFPSQSKGSHKPMEVKEGMELYPTGSRLPDCSYACGPCMPCRRVMVSFMTCSVESCPVVYRCVCKGRYFHVPTN